MEIVLLILSANDSISQNKVEWIKKSPRFLAMGLNIYHCYALSDPAYYERSPSLVPPTFDPMFHRIETAIIQCNPNYVILHTGAAFHSYPDLIVSALEKLKEKYPNISFGFEMKPSAEHLKSNPIFDEKAQTLSQLIFPRKR